MIVKTISQYLLEQSSNYRCGLVLPFQRIPNNFCDITNVYNYSVPADSIAPWQAASGSLSFEENQAIKGAIGEALERYAGAICQFDLKAITDFRSDANVLAYDQFSLFTDKQYDDLQFRWRRPATKQQYFATVNSLYDNKSWLVPQELLGLGSRLPIACLPSTSTGLAAHTNKFEALYSALLEVLERDAFVTYWLHSLGGREITPPETYQRQVAAKQGQVYCFDLTQDWNPYPVVAVCGYLPVNGKKRISMGVACRATFAQAIQKAYLEWIQGCIFAGFYDEHHPDLVLDDVKDVKSFDLHAVYYTKHPEQWSRVPLLRHRHHWQMQEKNQKLITASVQERLTILLTRLRREKIRLFYKDITPCDVKSAGVTVMRVLSPDLALLHGDENELFLGGTMSDVAWRFHDLKSRHFPNRYPHPLG